MGLLVVRFGFNFGKDIREALLEPNEDNLPKNDDANNQNDDDH